MGVGVNFLEPPRLEATFKAVKISPAFEEFGQNDVYKLLPVEDTKRFAGWKPGYCI